ncbi:MAG TPA: glycosyltransferase family 39 protein [Chroococcidiopsis sp.]
MGYKIHSFDESYTLLRVAGYTEAEIVQLLRDGTETKSVEAWLAYQRLSPDRGFPETMTALASQPEHAPLYYILVRLWSDWFGSAIATARSVAAIFGVLALPCVYWFCQELWRLPSVSWMAVSLMAVSPLHLLYAHEARQYTLWTVAILVSSTLLVRALRLQSKRSWALYMASVAFGLYSHVIFALVVVAHALYVAITQRFALNRSTLSYGLAALSGVLLFTPWIAVWVSDPPPLAQQMEQLYQDVSLRSLLQMWLRNLGRIFVDFNSPFPLDFHDPVTLISVFLALLVGYSFYRLFRHTDQSVWLLLLLLVGVTAFAFVLPDLALGGRRSASIRYLMPCIIGVEIIVAYALATLSFSALAKVRSQVIWRAVSALLISASLISCVAISQSPAWWTKDDHWVPAIAGIVNSTPKPLVIYSLPPAAGKIGAVGRIMPLLHRMDADVEVQLLVQPTVPEQIPAQANSVFLYRPHDQLLTWLKQDTTAHLIPVYKAESDRKPRLWQVIKT